MPFNASHFNQALGIKIAALHEDGATLRLPLKTEYLNGAGVIHGGVTATLADTAGGVAVTKVLKRSGTTIELKINYLAPAVEGELRARSYILRAGQRVAVMRAEVHCGDTHVAEALMTFALFTDRPGSLYPLVDEEEAAAG